MNSGVLEVTHTNTHTNTFGLFNSKSGRKKAKICSLSFSFLQSIPTLSEGEMKVGGGGTGGLKEQRDRAV